MSGPARVPGVDAAEWAGRALVALQFGLLALMAWRAWASVPVAFGTSALALLACSAAVGGWTLAANRPGNFNIRPTPRQGAALVTAGPYRWVRHPMYSAVLLAAAAAAVMSHRSLDALLWLALLAVLVAKAGMEERALTLRFPGYPDYMARTKRFVPWLA